ncbi:4'-phosphopantetheinyl transferase family protein [Hyphomicrobium sulfonivorans]|uniref:4'-phosphopantetheinyl transferase family protein n=1 Tax=Hyphomicrobium sulfonivorans TaxID=121290 RepID=UPI0015703ECE|nr:hypothetical protein [Hyphomicrobium sulfonivorans]MBI1650209.1 hypothetical protein [Hyphomicrobium sulfonivorans]NSL73125.1 hypothetical protein [Hyphomicrobium sulfonivorans]
MPHSAPDVPHTNVQHSDVWHSEIWFVDIAAAAPALQAFEARHLLLSAAEHERAAALRDDLVRNEWLAAHIALRAIVGRGCGPDVARQTFAVTERGKPFLAQSPYAFSLSHAPGVALIGLSAGRMIGVDIERHREVRIGDARRAGIEAAAAHLSVDVLPVDPTMRFLQAWVRIEALAKADGRGVGRMLTRLGVRGRAAAPPPADASGLGDDIAPIAARARAVLAGADQEVELAEQTTAPEPPSQGARALTVTDLAVAEGLYAAVASEAGAGPVVCRRLPDHLEGLEKLFG